MTHEQPAIDQRQQTIDTYERSAEDLAEYFKGIGPRVQDIDLVFDLLANPKNPKIVEIGCGDGRDAKEIMKRTDDYTGFDVANSFIEIAQRRVPEGHFEAADAVEFEFPPDTDAVFAFASLLHLSREENTELFKRVKESLKPGGIFYISLKYKPKYGQEVKADEYGSRLFYFYNEDDVHKIAGDGFTTEVNYRKVHGQVEWLEMALRKNPE